MQYLHSLSRQALESILFHHFYNCIFKLPEGKKVTFVYQVRSGKSCYDKIAMFQNKFPGTILQCDTNAIPNTIWEEVRLFLVSQIEGE